MDKYKQLIPCISLMGPEWRFSNIHTFTNLHHSWTFSLYVLIRINEADKKKPASKSQTFHTHTSSIELTVITLRESTKYFLKINHIKAIVSHFRHKFSMISLNLIEVESTIHILENFISNLTNQILLAKRTYPQVTCVKSKQVQIRNKEGKKEIMNFIWFFLFLINNLIILAKLRWF